MQQWTISWLYCDVWQKVNFIWQLVMKTSSVVGPRRWSKALPKAKCSPIKRSWSLFGGLLLVWSPKAFWIMAKPLHLRSMLSKSMRCTENCNACSQHWWTKRPQFFFTTTPNHTSHNQCFKSWTNWATNFCLICYIDLTSHQLTTTSSILTTFFRKNAFMTSKMQKMLSKSSLKPKARIFMLQE